MDTSDAVTDASDLRPPSAWELLHATTGPICRVCGKRNPRLPNHAPRNYVEQRELLDATAADIPPYVPVSGEDR